MYQRGNRQCISSLKVNRGNVVRRWLKGETFLRREKTSLFGTLLRGRVIECAERRGGRAADQREEPNRFLIAGTGGYSIY